MNNSHCPALGDAAAARQHHLAKQHSGYIGREKTLYCAFQLISCLQHPMTRPGGLGEIQAVTVYTKSQYIHGIYHVYTKDIEIQFS